MISIPTVVKTVERAIRIVPFVKELLPSNKDGLSSLIQSDSDEILKLNKKIKVIFKDYRDLKGSFDKLVSIEMIEAVGHKYYDEYFGKVNSL